jgi:hypothetical protein
MPYSLFPCACLRALVSVLPFSVLPFSALLFSALLFSARRRAVVAAHTSRAQQAL